MGKRKNKQTQATPKWWADLGESERELPGAYVEAAISTQPELLKPSASPLFDALMSDVRRGKK